MNRISGLKFVFRRKESNPQNVPKSKPVEKFWICLAQKANEEDGRLKYKTDWEPLSISAEKFGFLANSHGKVKEEKKSKYSAVKNNICRGGGGESLRKSWYESPQAFPLTKCKFHVFGAWSLHDRCC